MAKNHERPPRVGRRYARRATRRGMVIRPLRHPGRIIGVIIAVIAMTTIALVWGSVLKKKSDARQAALESGIWTLDVEIAQPVPVSVPDIRVCEIIPGERLDSDVYGGALLSLGAVDGELTFLSTVAEQAGLLMAADAGTLIDEVERLHHVGAYVVAAFHVTSFDCEDSALASYYRGLEMALLIEYARSGVDSLLLFGIPSGSDVADARASAYLADLRTLLSETEAPPALGVAVTLDTLSYTEKPTVEAESESTTEREMSPYVGSLSPARLLRACDYLVLDLSELAADESADELLVDLQYPYVRYALRLLVPSPETRISEEEPVKTLADLAISRGFTRLFEAGE